MKDIIKIVLLLCISFTLCEERAKRVKQSGSFIVINYQKYVEPHEEFTIELKGNPSTGYEWSLLNQNELKGTPIELLSSKIESYTKKEGEEEKAGVPLHTLFTFKANKPNGKNVILTFVYKRSWETTEFAQKITYQIAISPEHTNVIKTMTVKANTEFRIEIKEKIMGGCFLVNEENLKNYGIILEHSYVKEKARPYTMSDYYYRDTTYCFRFKAGEATNKPIVLEFGSISRLQSSIKYEITIVN